MNKISKQLAQLTVKFLKDVEGLPTYEKKEDGDQAKLDLLREFSAQARKLAYKQSDSPMETVMLDDIAALDTAPTYDVVFPRKEGEPVVCTTVRCVLSTGRALVDLRDPVPVGTIISLGGKDYLKVIATDPVQGSDGRKYSFCSLEVG